MNRSFLTLLVLCIFSFCHAQQFYSLDSFYQKGATWTEASEYDDLSDYYCEYYWMKGYQYFIGDDTMLAGGSHRLLYTQQVGFIKAGKCAYPTSSQNIPPYYYQDGTCFLPRSLGGLMFSNNKLYFYPFDPIVIYPNGLSAVDSILFKPDSEVLLYDFGPHSIGDTISWKNGHRIIQQIDTLLLPNGQNVKQYVFTPYWTYQTDIWTLGIGSTNGLFGAYGVPAISTYGCFSHCYRNADLSMVTNTCAANTAFQFASYINGWDCSGQLEPVPTIKNPQALSIYPNPASNEVNIEGQGLLRICDIAGREVLQAQLSGNAHHTIDISILGSGIYIYSISYDGMVSTGKLCVQR